MSLKLPADDDKRRAYLELEKMLERISEQKHEASKTVRQKMSNASEAELWVPFREKIEALEAPYRVHIAEIEAEYEAKEADLEKQIDALGLGDRRYDDDYERTLECTLTGLPIFDDDEIIRDDETGDIILRAVLPWPEIKVKVD